LAHEATELSFAGGKNFKVANSKERMEWEGYKKKKARGLNLRCRESTLALALVIPGHYPV
jgi:hypothetical protein